jgi:pilus assembly protein Flp/PilA
MMNLFNYLQARIAMNEERGAAAVEYALLVSLIALAIVGVVFLLGGDLSATFQSVRDNL